MCLVVKNKTATKKSRRERKRKMRQEKGSLTFNHSQRLRENFVKGGKNEEKKIV